MIDAELFRITQDALDRGAIQKGHELLPFLQLVSALNPQVIVEIGSDRGGTLHALHNAAPTATLISVDLPSGPFSTGAAIQPPPGAILIQGDSHSPNTLSNLVVILAGRPITVLLIDGDHSYEGVKQDYEMYAPLVDGVVALHDIVPHPTDPAVAVHRFWGELEGEKAELLSEPLYWGGIGVIRHGRS